MKLYILIFIFLLFGCGKEETVWGNMPFIEMEQNSIILSEQILVCKNKPTSVFCSNSISVGDIHPTKAYAIKILKEMNSNFKYKVDNTWHYNNTIYEDLVGDCEDIASTMAKHMIEEGIGKEYLYLAYRKISETEAHMFLVVDTKDTGLLHLDYENSGYPIEPKINFHMRLDNPGIYKWMKGNIR